MATNDPSHATNGESLKDPKAPQLDDDNEQINLDEASKVSGGGSYGSPS